MADVRRLETVLAGAYVLYALFLATTMTSCLPDCLLPFTSLIICYLFSALGVLRNKLWGYVLLTLTPAGAVLIALFRLVQVYSSSAAIDIGAALFIMPVNVVFLVASLYPSSGKMRATHSETHPKAPGAVKKQETQVDARYVEYLATLEEMKTAGRITEETYRKLKDEYWKRFAERDT